MEIISQYTREQALEDGELVDISITPDSPIGDRHVACTASVWAIIDKAVENKKHLNDLQGVLWDIHWMASRYAKADTDRFLFKVIITGAGRKRIFIFRAVCHPGDNLEPVITIMQPDED